MNTPTPDFDADTHLREAQQRGLGSRPWLRMIAVTTWISFLCGGVALMIFLLMIPESFNHMVGLDWLSGFFFMAWACGFATALVTSLMIKRIWQAGREES